ncbi:scoloptoxin SSD14-like isoform X2 [Tubulanus polymorphus]|uniref:scoloptoxin SSD14-like isoform X2 n=1 Tax=Tubulanus polymorphus TaxID=672921 RepID=UPI003DA55C6C
MMTEEKNESNVAILYEDHPEYRPTKRCSCKKLAGVFIVFCIGVAIITGLLFSLAPKPPLPFGPPRDPTKCDGVQKTYSKATVVTDASYCSVIGTDMLRKNGSAIDAAITTALCLGVANSHSTGIGGGFFMNFYDRATKKLHTLDARETAPLAATEDMFVGKPEEAREGGKSLGVPGQVAGYWAAHQAFGRLSWEDLFQPTIELCEDGIPMTPGTHLAAKARFGAIMNNTYLKAIYVNPATDDIYEVGEKIKRPILAKTLKLIALEGADTYYNGSLAEDIIKDLKEYSSIVTKEDLSQYRVKWRQPTSIKLNSGLTVHSLPPPSSGGLVGYILSILDGYNYKPRKLDEEQATLFFHRFIEAMKFGYAARAELGDEDFVDVKKILDEISSPQYAASRREMISDNRTYDPSYYGNITAKIGQFGTSHFSLVAPNGDAVAFTSTINFYFGSKVVGNRTNIIFNNEMDDFSTPNQTNGFGLAPSPSNFIRPGKRPMSSMAPVIVTDNAGDVINSMGASGGSKIISAVAQSLIENLWFRDSLKDSIDEPRLHHQWLPNEVVYESTFSKKIIENLKELGHNFTQLSGRGAVVQGINRIDSGMLEAYSDPRKGGCPDGF